MKFVLGALMAVLLALPLASTAQRAEVPYLTGRVVDNAEILRPDTRQQVTELLRQHEQRTSNQVANVVTSVGPYTCSSL